MKVTIHTHIETKLDLGQGLPLGADWVRVYKVALEHALKALSNAAAAETHSIKVESMNPEDEDLS